MARRKNPAYTRDCANCGQVFRPWKVDGKYCSKRCTQTADRVRKRKPLNLKRPDSHEIAWAAGFTDGEGCFDATAKVAYNTSIGRRERRYLRLTVSQKDPQLLERLTQAFGVGSIYFDRARPGRSHGHKWVCNGREAFYVADLLWPWLGEQKRADFKRALRLVHGTRTDFVRQPQRGRLIVVNDGGPSHSQV